MSIIRQLPRILECKFCGVGLVYTEADFAKPEHLQVMSDYARSHGPGQCKEVPNAIGTPANETLTAQLVFADLEEGH